MKYKKISIQTLIEQHVLDDWNEFKKNINAQTGFITYDEKKEVLNYKTTQKRYFSYSNLKFANVIKHKNLNIEENIINLQYENGKLIVNNFPVSVWNAYFTCPNCDIEYIVDCNPARCNRVSTSICGKCQKAWLHKFTSYQKNYEHAMLKKHGVKRPFQKKEFLQKACQTRIDLYGKPYPMQRDDVKKKHAEVMIKKWGRPNYFSNFNMWKEYDFFKRGFISKFELEVANICNEIFGDETRSCITKKPKFYSETEDRYYSPDFYDPKRNFIIEFNGDYFHANPELYDEHKIFNAGKTYGEIRLSEVKRYESLKQFCDTVYIVWENNWKKNKLEVIELLKEIKNAYDENTFISKEKLLGWQP